MTLLDHHLFSTVTLEFSKRQNFEKMTNFNRRKSVYKGSVKRGENKYGSQFFTFNSPLIGAPYNPAKPCPTPQPNTHS